MAAARVDPKRWGRAHFPTVLHSIEPIRWFQEAGDNDSSDPNKNRERAKRASDEVLADRFELEARAVRVQLGRLKQLSDQLKARVIPDATDFRRFVLAEMLADVDRMVGNAQQRLVGDAQAVVKDAADLGDEHARQPLAAARVPIGIGDARIGLDPALIDATFDNLAVLLSEPMQQFRNDVVVSIRRLAVAGDNRMTEIKRLRDIIAGQGFDNAQYRAERIIRTELGRTFNEAMYARLLKLSQDFPFMRKGWRATKDKRTRPTHVTAGQRYARGTTGVIPIPDLFVVGQAKLRFPVDPLVQPPGRIGAQETIMCRCNAFVDFDLQDYAEFVRGQIQQVFPGAAGPPPVPIVPAPVARPAREPRAPRPKRAPAPKVPKAERPKAQRAAARPATKAAPAPAVPTKAAAAATELATAEVVSVQALGGGVNVTQIVTLRGADGQTFKAVFKPTKGEKFILDGRPVRTSVMNKQVTLAEREAAAYRVDALLGTKLVPETIMRTMPRSGAGSLQRFVDGAITQHEATGGMSARGMSEDELYRFSVLDMLIGNTDRHAGNFMVQRISGQPKRYIAIDHGYSFPDAAGVDTLGTRQWRSAPAAQLLLTDGSASAATRAELLEGLRNERGFDAILNDYAFTEAERAAFHARRRWLIRRIEANDLASRLEGYGGFGFAPKKLTLEDQ